MRIDTRTHLEHNCKDNNVDDILNNIPETLKNFIAQLSSSLNLKITSESLIYKDKKLIEYGAIRLNVNDKMIEFRVGKRTPDRPGHFLTSWYRGSDNKITPFHENELDLLLVYTYEVVNTQEFHGIYVFGKSILKKQGILSTNDTLGKLGFRVFPPWSEYSALEAIKTSKRDNEPLTPMQTFSKSAKSTQLWQNKYFCNISPEPNQDDIKFFAKLLEQ